MFTFSKKYHIGNSTKKITNRLFLGVRLRKMFVFLALLLFPILLYAQVYPTVDSFSYQERGAPPYEQLTSFDFTCSASDTVGLDSMRLDYGDDSWHTSNLSGETSYTKTGTNRYPSPGTYTASCKARNTEGGTDTEQISVTVIAAPVCGPEEYICGQYSSCGQWGTTRCSAIDVWCQYCVSFSSGPNVGVTCVNPPTHPNIIIEPCTPPNSDPNSSFTTSSASTAPLTFRRRHLMQTITSFDCNDSDNAIVGACPF